MRRIMVDPIIWISRWERHLHSWHYSVSRLFFHAENLKAGETSLNSIYICNMSFSELTVMLSFWLEGLDIVVT